MVQLQPGRSSIVNFTLPRVLEDADDTHHALSLYSLSSALPVLHDGLALHSIAADVRESTCSHARLNQAPGLDHAPN